MSANSVEITNTLVKEPIYQQANQVLRSLIDSGEFRVGDQFLTERQICDRFQISRATANKALSNLVSEGLLEFRKGVGTFVRGRPMDYNLRALVSFTEEALASGKKPATRVLRFESLPANETGDEVSSALKARYDEPLFYMERLRLADDIPVILERRHVVAKFCPDLTRADLNGSLYELWAERYQLAIEGAVQSIRSVNIRGEDATVLGVCSGSAGLLVTSVGQLKSQDPLWFERTLYRGDAYEFQNRLGGVQVPCQPLGKFLELGPRKG